MAKVAILIDEMFEDIEYSEPAKAFKQKGHQLTTVGMRKGSIVNGKTGGTQVTIDASINNVQVNDFDALFIPGGYSPDHLRTDSRVLSFTKEFMNSGKPVFAICHAPQLLISAEALGGRRVTGWKSIVQDIKNAGAIYVDKDVVEDKNLISSRGPSDIPAFVNASLHRLEDIVK